MFLCGKVRPRGDGDDLLSPPAKRVCEPSEDVDAELCIPTVPTEDPDFFPPPLLSSGTDWALLSSVLGRLVKACGLLRLIAEKLRLVVTREWHTREWIPDTAAYDRLRLSNSKYYEVFTYASDALRQICEHTQLMPPEEEALMEKIMPDFRKQVSEIFDDLSVGNLGGPMYREAAFETFKCAWRVWKNSDQNTFPVLHLVAEAVSYMMHFDPLTLILSTWDEEAFASVLSRMLAAPAEILDWPNECVLPFEWGVPATVALRMAFVMRHVCHPSVLPVEGVDFNEYGGVLFLPPGWRRLSLEDDEVTRKRVLAGFLEGLARLHQEGMVHGLIDTSTVGVLSSTGRGCLLPGLLDDVVDYLPDEADDLTMATLVVQYFWPEGNFSMESAQDGAKSLYVSEDPGVKAFPRSWLCRTSTEGVLSACPALQRTVSSAMDACAVKTAALQRKLNVTSVERIVNRDAWIVYAEKRSIVRGTPVQANPPMNQSLCNYLDIDREANEILLFLSVPNREVAENVALQGIQYLFYDAGIFFSTEATKTDTYSSADVDGNRFMLVCAVALGKCVIQEEKPLPGDHDSVCLRGERLYEEYVVFDPAHVYPHLLVTYQRKDSATK